MFTSSLKFRSASSLEFQNTPPLSGSPCSFSKYSYLDWRFSAASRHSWPFLRNFAPDKDWLRFSSETRYYTLSGASLQLVTGSHISRLIHGIRSMFLAYLTNVVVLTWGPVSFALVALQGWWYSRFVQEKLVETSLGFTVAVSCVMSNRLILNIRGVNRDEGVPRTILKLNWMRTHDKILLRYAALGLSPWNSMIHTWLCILVARSEVSTRSWFVVIRGLLSWRYITLNLEHAEHVLCRFAPSFFVIYSLASFTSSCILCLHEFNLSLLSNVTLDRPVNNSSMRSHNNFLLAAGALIPLDIG